MKIFNVIKLAKFVKKKSAKTFICDSRCFSGDYNETSLQMKIYGQLEVLTDVFFFLVRFIEKLAPMRYIYKHIGQHT